MSNVYTLEELEQITIKVRDAMFPKNGKPFSQLKLYDKKRYIRGTANLIKLIEEGLLK